MPPVSPEAHAWLLVPINLVRSVLDVSLFDLGGQPVTISTVLIVLLCIFAAYWTSSVVNRRVEKALEKSGVSNEGAIAVASRFGHYAIMLMGLGVGLQTAGINLAALFAAGAVFAIGLGFAVQNVTQNFVSGVILLVEGAIKPGDILYVEDRMVRIGRMGIRSTVARTLDDIEVILPNSLLVTSSVLNLTMSDRLTRIRINVGVVYGADPMKTRDTLTEVSETFSQRESSRPPVVLLTGFGSSSVDWEVSVWTAEPWHRDRVASALRLAIWDALKREGLVIAFPQVDVHFDAPVIEALRRSA